MGPSGEYTRASADRQGVPDTRSLNPATQKFLYACAFWVMAADDELKADEQIWLADEFGEDISREYGDEFLAMESDDFLEAFDEMASALSSEERERVQYSLEEWLIDCAGADGQICGEERESIRMILERLAVFGAPVEETTPETPPAAPGPGVESDRPAVARSTLLVMRAVGFAVIGGIILYFGVRAFGMAATSSAPLFRTYYYAKASLMVMAIIILLARYVSKPCIAAGIWTFVFQLLHVFLCFKVRGAWVLVLPVIQFASAVAFLTFVGKCGKQKEPRAAAIWCNSVVPLLPLALIIVGVMGFSKYGGDIIVAAGKMSLWIVGIVGVLGFLGIVTDKSGKNDMTAKEALTGIPVMCVLVFLVVLHSKIVVRAPAGPAHIAPWIFVLDHLARMVVAFFFLLCPSGILNCMWPHRSVFLGASAFSLVAAFGFLAPLVLRAGVAEVSMFAWAGVLTLDLIGWGLAMAFLIVYPISSTRKST